MKKFENWSIFDEVIRRTTKTCRSFGPPCISGRCERARSGRDRAAPYIVAVFERVGERWIHVGVVERHEDRVDDYAQRDE